jgi:hypothetical protein
LHQFSKPSSRDRAGNWFLYSGIQEPSGGVSRYYRSDVGENRRVSTEITGYAVSAFLYLHALSGECAYLEAARRAGRFLAEVAWDRKLQVFPFECGDTPDGGVALAYFFDCGIILRGLLGLWRATGEPWTLAGARNCGESMIRDFAPEAGPHPTLELPSKRPLPREPRWSRSPGCYQLKSALGWYELGEATGEERWMRPYHTVLAKALETCTTFLDMEDDQELVMDRLHAYCYFLEGLLPCVKRPECAAALRRGIEQTARLLREISPRFERSDVCAQLLRVRLYADALGAVELDRTAAEDEVRRVSRYQLDAEDPRLAGGFVFGRRAGKLTPHVNPVSTAFSVQALEMWRRHQNGEPQLARHMLI